MSGVRKQQVDTLRLDTAARVASIVMITGSCLAGILAWQGISRAEYIEAFHRPILLIVGGCLLAIAGWRVKVIRERGFRPGVSLGSASAACALFSLSLGTCLFAYQCFFSVVLLVNQDYVRWFPVAGLHKKSTQSSDLIFTDLVFGGGSAAFGLFLFGRLFFHRYAELTDDAPGVEPQTQRVSKEANPYESLE